MSHTEPRASVSVPITPDTPCISTLDALADLPAAEWNALAGNDPFLSCEFLSALETSGCAVPKTGWCPQFLLAHEAGKLVGGMPLYLKSHSYGEYVFDWAWADAYARHGLAYYPKLLAAVPFTPITGTRILAQSDHIAKQLIHAALQLAKNLNVSSLHCLFPEAAQIPALQAAGMSVRHGVQFHWQNLDYPDFDAYLSGMNNEKRKKIKQERRRVRDAGISFEWVLGHQATAAQWAFFFACYAQTYHAHSSTPYLNPDFFQRIAASMGEKILLVFAVREGKMIAGAFNVFTSERLYGRYWGAMEQHSGLHFETCYYQAIEFCIAHRIAVFEGGAQGEHKLARGFLPVQTLSTHWLAHERLGRAVDDFLVREQAGLEHYANELNERSPFKQV
ncbi:MAG: GNAT family N-acetyltransferase [Betaproteobacteria bacterium]|nr:GNAT family N-acetyltransferase [Betaproteobacteria bacterium]